MDDMDLDLGDIDYMHPFGKPKTKDKQTKSNGGDDKPDWRSMRLALSEADGHSMKRRDPFLHADDDDREQ